MRTDHIPHVSCYKSSGPTPVKCNCWMFCPLKSCSNQCSRSTALAFSKEDFVTIFFRLFLPAIAASSETAELQEGNMQEGWRGACGQNCSSQTQLPPSQEEKVVLVEGREVKKKGVNNTFLSLHPHLPLKPILKVRIIVSSVSVVEGTPGVCSHLSFGASEGELCQFELSGKSLISNIYRGAAHILQ